LTLKSHIYPQRSPCKPASTLLPVASSLQHPCSNNVLRLFLYHVQQKNTINQKECHVATKHLNKELRYRENSSGRKGKKERCGKREEKYGGKRGERKDSEEERKVGGGDESKVEVWKVWRSTEKVKKEERKNVRRKRELCKYNAGR
jgi:hypothetical protein